MNDLYEPITENQKELIKKIKEKGNEIGALIDNIPELVGDDNLSSACNRDMAKTYIQTGLMWLVKSIANPKTFC